MVPPQSSIRERDHFWKFYDNLETLKNGLKHKDYDHVVEVLKKYVNAERTLFIRHCHTVLALEVIKSQVHVENTIKKAGNDKILDFNYPIQYPDSPVNAIPTTGNWIYYTKKTYT